MKKFLGILLISFPLWATTPPETAYIEIKGHLFDHLAMELPENSLTPLMRFEGTVLAQTPSALLPSLSMHIHDTFKTCGGFLASFSKGQAFRSFWSTMFPPLNPFVAPKDLYGIDQSSLVQSLMEDLQSQNIFQTIDSLSAFHNRYYTSDHGVQSMKFIHDSWAQMAQGRSDVKVDYMAHQHWKQPSVILRIEGKSRPEEIIVVGGHGDSISGFFFPKRNRAPGADDNASGISVITEVIRVLLEEGVALDRTIVFASYAAEEVGLLGSREMAQDFRAKGLNVVGALQLDLAAHQGAHGEINLIQDYTNAKQNEFLGDLMDRYLPSVKWSYGKCGYPCSDHASWHSEGFPSSFPTELHFNPKIHTEDDTIALLSEDYSLIFAKLALAYIIELGSLSTL